ncbi:MAG: hypothetical protein FWD67_02635 [Betaproteobacteria bacterium]|nr:hypothetical protein [Betaproteobacteria bacterium]
MSNGLKYSLTNVCAAVAGMLACVAFLSIAGCTEKGSPPQAGAAPSANVDVIKDLSFFDSITTLDAVFPDPAVQALFEVSPPEMKEPGSRVYLFALTPQTNGLYVVSIKWVLEGTSSQVMGGGGNLGRGEVFYTTNTPDGKYELFVLLQTQLPFTAVVPQFDLEGTAKRLLLRYSQHLSNQLPEPLRDE